VGAGQSVCAALRGFAGPGSAAAPEIGTRGHVHHLELDQFVGENFLVTVHGPLNHKAPLEAALRETNAVATRMDSGPLHPTSRLS
jgi:magnesium transporter